MPWNRTEEQSLSEHASWTNESLPGPVRVLSLHTCYSFYSSPSGEAGVPARVPVRPRCAN